MIALTGIFVSEIKHDFFRTAIFGGLVSIFFLQSIFLVAAHDFKGLSSVLSKIPQDKVVMTDFIDPVRYYRQGYLNDSKINNKAFIFLEKFFVNTPPMPNERKIVSYREFDENKSISVDFALVTEFYFERGFSLGSEFTKCIDIYSGKYKAFWVFAKSKSLCSYFA